MKNLSTKKNTKGFMDRKGRRHRLKSFLRDTDPKIIRRTIFIALALVVVLIVMLFADSEPQLMASEEIVKVREKGVLTVGVLEDIPGFYENGQGLEADIALRLAQKILPEMSGGSGISFLTVTNTSVDSHLTDGSIDAALALMKKGENENYVYSKPYYTDTIGIAVKKGNKNINFANKTIGYVFEGKKMNVPQELLEYSEKNNVSLKAYAGYPDMLSALASSKIDGAMIYGVYAKKYMSEYEFEMSAASLGYAEYALAALADNSAFVEIADIILKEF